MSAPFEFSADQRLWIDDLKTTDAKQGTGLLQSVNGEFCCLGRACEIFQTPQVPPARENVKGVAYAAPIEPSGSDQVYAILPSDLRKRLNLRSDAGLFLINRVSADWYDKLDNYNMLIDLNDQLEWPFEKIGRFIEENPTAVFKC